MGARRPGDPQGLHVPRLQGLDGLREPRGRPRGQDGPPPRHPHQLLAGDADPEQPRRGRPHRARLPPRGPDRRVKALVAGAQGQLGRDLVVLLGSEVAWAGGRAELDVTDWEAVWSVVARVRPDVIFNGAAYNKVDGAETEAGRALEVNALAPSLLAGAAREVGALLVHFSTDYVFDGRSKHPYREDDCPRPLSPSCARVAAGSITSPTRARAAGTSWPRRGWPWRGSRRRWRRSRPPS